MKQSKAPPSAVQNKPAREKRPTVKKDTPTKKRKDGDKGSVATLLVRLAIEAGVRLFHTADGVAYVAVPRSDHQENLRLRSSAFALWLKRSFFAATKRTPGAQAVTDAVGVLEGIALHDCPAEPVSLRVGEKDGKLYLDLADTRWRAVEIDTAGWRIVDAPPVHFRRQRGTLPLPEPRQGGSIDQLRPFLNIGSDEDWRLAVAWLLAALRPQGPYPLAVLSGQQGSAKSTTARALRLLVDPNSSPIRSEPKEARDLMIAANASWVIALDNLSTVPAWLSDALCRLATGGGFASRQLYTDDEEAIFDAQRPAILTSIEDLTTRGDLLERSLVLVLPPIPQERRRPEKYFWADYEAARPYILGALLDAVAGGLRELPGVSLDRLPRMADSAQWATAGERALGWPSGSFLRAYDANQSAANDVALESSPLVSPLRQLLAESGEWAGTAGELLEALTRVAGEQAARGRDWPKNGQVLSGKLRRLAPNLAAIGVSTDLGLRTGKSRKRIIKLWQETAGENAAAPSAPSAHAENPEESQGPGGRATDGLAVQADASGPEPVRPEPAKSPAKSEAAKATTAADAKSRRVSYLAPEASPDILTTPFDHQ